MLQSDSIFLMIRLYMCVLFGRLLLLKIYCRKYEKRNNIAIRASFQKYRFYHLLIKFISVQKYLYDKPKMEKAKHMELDAMKMF